MAQNRKPTYLIMITANNNNKFYRMLPNSNGTFDVEYGRIGAATQKRTYPMSDWDKKYREKVNKGYVDQTDLMDDLVHEEKAKGNNDYKEIENKVIAKIVERLQNMAHQTIQKNYKVEAIAVTQAMVDKAQEQIDMMANNYKTMSLQTFNDNLIKLFGIIPRKMKDVNSHLAEKTEDFESILTREQDLLDVMKGQVVQHTAQTEDTTEEGREPQNTILDALGLVFEEVTDEEVAHIKVLMGDNASRFKNAWKVTNVKTQKRFDEFVTAKQITDVKELWHGSGNANWWSIIGSGLNIRPANAASNGRMLGNGLYMANNSTKSISYSSRSPYSWNHEATGFLGIMQVAYGKPYDVNAFDPKYYNFDYAKLQEVCPGANCLHAHKGFHTGWNVLKNDEIVVYKEEQVTIKYLVEFE